jgi:hypothetical protein
MADIQEANGEVIAGMWKTGFSAGLSYAVGRKTAISYNSSTREVAAFMNRRGNGIPISAFIQGAEIELLRTALGVYYGDMSVDVGWTDSGGVVSSQSSEQAHSGIHSRKITVVAGESGLLSSSDFPVALLAGESVWVECWVYPTDDVGLLSLGVYDSGGGADVATLNFSMLSTSVPTVGQWNRVSFSGAVLTGGVKYFKLNMDDTTTNNGPVLYLDDLVVKTDHLLFTSLITDGIIPNSNMENKGFWMGGNTGRIISERTNEIVYSGDYSWKVVSNGNTPAGVGFGTPNLVNYLGSTKYRIQATVRPISSNPTETFSLYGEGDIEIDESFAVNSNVWTTITSVGSMADGPGGVIYLNSSCTSSFYVDEHKLII